jgi:hypothetical protein
MSNYFHSLAMTIRLVASPTVLFAATPVAGRVVSYPTPRQRSPRSRCLALDADRGVALRLRGDTRSFDRALPTPLF